MDPVIGVILVGIIGPLLTYLVAAKRFTGEVKTSDAEQLWAESRSIREWSADRIAQLTGIITSLETRVKHVEERNTTLANENDRLMTKVDELRDIIDALRDDLKGCATEVAKLNAALSKSEDRVDVLEEEADTPESERRNKDDDHE